MKGLPSSLRGKKRYLAFRVYSDEPVARNDVIRAVWRESIGFLGENTASELEMWVLDYDEDVQEGFLVCGHKQVGRMKAVLTLVNSHKDKRFSIHPLGVSGTVKALNRKFLNKVRD
jgi:ribonuclease P/MRP protein subunit POP5